MGMEKTITVNILLTLFLGCGLVVFLFCKTFYPALILPQPDMVGMAAFCIPALLMEYYMIGFRKRSWFLQTVLAGISFGVLPYAAGIATAGIKMGITGMMVFLIVTLMFHFSAEKVELTGGRKAIMIPTSFIIYLAIQCFMGWK